LSDFQILKLSNSGSDQAADVARYRCENGACSEAKSRDFGQDLQDIQDGFPKTRGRHAKQTEGQVEANRAQMVTPTHLNHRLYAHRRKNLGEMQKYYDTSRPVQTFICVLVAIVRKQLGFEISLSQLLQILSVNVFAQVPPAELVAKTTTQYEPGDIRNQLMPWHL
jgi:hypothetical protein